MLLFGSLVCQWAAQPRTKAGALINRWFENAAERFLLVVRLPAIVAVARPPQPQRPARALPWPWRNSAGWMQNAVSALTTFPGRVWSLCFKGLPRRIVCFCLDAVTQQKVARGGGGRLEGSVCESPGCYFFCYAWSKQAVCIMAGGSQDLFLWLQHEQNPS